MTKVRESRRLRVVEGFGPLLERASGMKTGRDFRLGYSPERIDPGNSIWKLENTPKVVSGIDPPSTEAVQRLLASLIDTVVPVASCKEAELTETAGEHLPAREHRPRQRAGDLRPRSGHRRLGRHRRSIHQAADTGCLSAARLTGPGPGGVRGLNVGLRSSSLWSVFGPRLGRLRDPDRRQLGESLGPEVEDPHGEIFR